MIRLIRPGCPLAELGTYLNEFHRPASSHPVSIKFWVAHGFVDIERPATPVTVCPSLASMSPIRQGDTLDGSAESFLAECVVKVFENENIVRTVRRRRHE